MRLSLRLALVALVVLTLIGANYLSRRNVHAQGNNSESPTVFASVCTAAPPGMVAWWPGEGNADDIRGENNGTLQGSPTFPAGEVGQAFGLNGSNQYVSIPDSPSLQLTNLTIDAWVNPTDLTQDRAILIKSALATLGNDFAYGLRVLSDGHAEGRITDAGGAFASVVSTSVLSTNQFQHIALTYDGAALKLYVNGVLDATTATNLTPVQNTNPVSIGAWQSVSAGVIQYWFGRIDEVELFSRALDITEIQAIFDAGSAGKCRPRCVTPPSGMVGWWTGDDNPFDIWSTNHGTFESGPSPSPSASPYVDGKVGRAFNFDGSGSYVDLDTYSGFDLTDAITIDAWVRPTGIPSAPPVFPNQKGKVNPNQLGGGFEGILTKWQSSQVSGSAQPEQAGDSYGLWLASEQTGESLTLYGAVETDCGTDSVFGGTVPLNVWSHVAMTYDSNTGDLVLYVNGVLVNSVNTDCGVMNSTSTQVNIGCQSCGATQTIDPFTGQIDEVEVFNVALLSSSIEAINNGASAGKCKPCLTPPPNMVGWWDGDANSNDSSGSGNNGSLPGGGAGYAFGKVGQAFSFNASAGSGVLVPSSSALNPTDAITLDAWVNPSSYPNFAPTVIRKDTNPEATQYSLLIGDGQITGVAHCKINNTTLTGGLVPLNQWSHLACTYDSQTQNIRLYVNGVQVDSGEPSPGPIPTASGDLAIGMEGSNGGNFDGLIDEVEVFNRALTQTEIQSIVAAGASGKCKSTCPASQVFAANPSGQTATVLQSPCLLLTGNHPDAVETDQVGDVSVTGDVNVTGGTDYQTLDIYSAGPMPFGYDTPIEIADISTTKTFTGGVTVCFNLQAVTDQTTFNQLRVLHLEGNVLVDRTSSHFLATRSLCATVSSLSPFVITQNQNAGPTAAPASISGQVTRPDGSPLASVVIQLSGNTPKLAITDNNGFYSFAELDTNAFYSVTPELVNYSFTPFQRSFSLLANTTDAVFTGTPNAVVIGSPIDTTGYFVRQHYLDFLNREPDESGFNFWSNSILSCGNDASCLEVKRINTSAAYFLSIEFQQTGYLVYRMYQAAYGDLPGAPVPVRFNEFMPDTREIGQNVIVNRAGWEQTLENNKQAFADAFVARTRFTGRYGAMDDAQFVNTVNQNASNVLSAAERDDLLASLVSRRRTRAQVLRIVAENAQLARLEFNKAFVLMEYFGYLRRDPNAGPDVDFGGYNFWLSKLDQFDGNFERAEMVKAFINSGEYRGRFPR